MQRGVYVKHVQVPLPELWEGYLAYAKAHTRSWQRDVQMYGNLQKVPGTATLENVTALRVEEFQQRRAQEVSPATVNRETALLKHMFNMAERWLAASPPYLRELILFAVNTGLRCGDIFDLKWQEVDLESKRIALIMGKTRHPLEVPLNETAFGVLNQKRAVMHGPYVFYSQVTGDRFSDLKAGFKAVLNRARLSGITWHTLPHTFASRLTRSGADLVTVKELLGHSTVTVTMRYAHTNHETRRTPWRSSRVVTK